MTDVNTLFGYLSRLFSPLCEPSGGHSPVLSFLLFHQAERTALLEQSFLNYFFVVVVVVLITFFYYYSLSW